MLALREENEDVSDIHQKILKSKETVTTEKKIATQIKRFGKKVESDYKGSRGRNQRETAYINTNGPTVLKIDLDVGQNMNLQAVHRLPSGNKVKKNINLIHR